MPSLASIWLLISLIPIFALNGWLVSGFLRPEFGARLSPVARASHRDSLILRKLQKITPPTPFHPRHYTPNPPPARSLRSSLHTWQAATLDRLYESDYSLPHRKRHRGGRRDFLNLKPRSVAIAKWLPLSPIKATKLLRQVRKLPVLAALGDLAQRGSNPYAVAIYKVIKSALANWQVMWGSELAPKFAILSATPAGCVKRVRFRAKGRCEVRRGPKVHVRVELTC